MRRIARMRTSEKAAEFLQKSGEALLRGQVANAISLLYHATTIYKAKFNAVRLELNAAKRRGLLPQNFTAPKNRRELKKTG